MLEKKVYSTNCRYTVLQSQLDYKILNGKSLRYRLSVSNAGDNFNFRHIIQFFITLL